MLFDECSEGDFGFWLTELLTNWRNFDFLSNLGQGFDNLGLGDLWFGCRLWGGSLGCSLFQGLGRAWRDRSGFRNLFGRSGFLPWHVVAL